MNIQKIDVAKIGLLSLASLDLDQLEAKQEERPSNVCSLDILQLIFEEADRAYERMERAKAFVFDPADLDMLEAKEPSWIYWDWGEEEYRLEKYGLPY